MNTDVQGLTSQPILRSGLLELAKRLPFTALISVFICVICGYLTSCGSDRPHPPLREPITRKQEEQNYTIPKTTYCPPEPYPWESKSGS